MKRNIVKGLSLLLLGAAGLLAQKSETIPFLALMQPGNETPAISDTASGNAIVWVHVVRDASGAVTSGSVDFDVSTKFSSAATVTGLHIHKGAAGVAGGIVIPTDLNGTSNTLVIDSTGKTRIQKQVQAGSGAVDPAIITDLLAHPDGYYVNIHNTDHPSGAMRGQLLPADMKILMGMMSPNNEVPPAAVNGAPVKASAVASVTLLRGKDSTGAPQAAAAIFNADYSNVDATAGTSFTGFHIHSQVKGVNGSVVINTGIAGGANAVPIDPSGSGNLNYVVHMSPLDASWATAGINGELNTVNSLFVSSGNQYINLHTNVFGGGVMRDQMRTTEQLVFPVNLDPANEVPAVTGVSSTSPSNFVLNVIRNDDGTVAAGTATFDVNHRGFPASTTFTGLHVHQAAAGTNGGIVIFSGVDGTANKVVSDTGSGNIFRVVNVDTAAGITALNAIVQNPNGFYANIHTTVNAGGAARSQLTGTLGKPTITGIADNVSTITTVAPGGVISIFGSNLSPISSDLSGFGGITSLTTGINGLSVTIGGVKAPFYFAGPGQLNVQVPFETAAGAQPVIVTNATGASAAFSVTVANVAPSIFALPDGSGILTNNADFSLFTSSNKAKAGDTLVIWMTGLGQSAPAMKTGELVPSDTLRTVSAPLTVTIGGQNAPLIAAAASPNFAGLYQVAVTVPSGVTGSVPVIVKSGATASNSVSLSVQ